MTVGLSARQIVEESDSPLLALAPWWSRVRLGDIADVQNGAPFESSHFNRTGTGVPLIRIRDVGSEDTSTYYSGPFAESYLVNNGDLLIGMDGDFRVARWTGRQGLLNQRVCRLVLRRPEIYSARLLSLVLQPYLDEINRRTSSITVKHLSSKTVAELPLPLPPRSEQDRLVDELERRLSHVDAAISGLRRSSALLDRLATVVREAVANGSLLAMDISSWTKASAGDVTEVRGGIQKQPKRRPGVNAYPFLRVANVGRGVLDLKDVHRIELFDGELKSYALQQGDLLVVEGNGSPDQIGRAAMFDGSIADCVHQNHLIRVRPSDLLDARFLNFVWNAPSTVKQLVSVASSTSGLHTLSTGKVKSVKLSIPPIRDQRLLVAEAERRLSLVFAARRTVASDRTKAVALRRSLLAAAFSGQLVPQDEGDEPATVLLERIKASSPADDGPVGRRSKRKEKVS